MLLLGTEFISRLERPDGKQPHPIGHRVPGTIRYNNKCQVCRAIICFGRRKRCQGLHLPYWCFRGRVTARNMHKAQCIPRTHADRVTISDRGTRAEALLCRLRLLFMLLHHQELRRRIVLRKAAKHNFQALDNSAQRQFQLSTVSIC